MELGEDVKLSIKIVQDIIPHQTHLFVEDLERNLQSVYAFKQSSLQLVGECSKLTFSH